MNARNVVTFESLDAVVRQRRAALNAFEETSSLAFMQAQDAYREAKKKRDAFSYNLKKLTSNGKLVRT